LANTKEDIRGTGVLYADEILESLSHWIPNLSIKALALFLSRNIDKNEAYSLEQFS